jgi:hypothetical protein
MMKYYQNRTANFSVLEIWYSCLDGGGNLGNVVSKTYEHDATPDGFEHSKVVIPKRFIC